MTDKQIKEKVDRMAWEKWRDSKDIVERTAYAINQLSPHNLWKAKAWLLDLIDVKSKALLSSVRQETIDEVCICSAVKTSTGLIVRGNRHGDCFRAIKDMDLKPSKSADAQGFITSKNRFVTREQGRKLQDKAGIPSADKEGYRGTTLFSEDLY